MRENYRRWDVDIGVFPKEGNNGGQLKFILQFAVLAPSGHNSQPWEFSVSDDFIEVWANEERSLAQSDPDRRQLLIAIGCAIENILIAADYYGLESTVHYLPRGHQKNLIAVMNFQNRGTTKSHDKNHLIFSIPHRLTNRGKYKQDAPPRHFLEELRKFSGNDFEVAVITEKEKRHKIADVACAAQIEVMEFDSFREELSHYIKHNFTKSKTGMPGFTLGLPAPISLIASHLIKRINMSKKSAKQDEKLLKEFTPAFVVISSAHDNPINRIKAGQIFERIWLLATREQLSCAPLAAPVQVGDYYKNVQEILGTKSRPLGFFRLGHSDKIPRHSPRFSVEEVLK